MIDLTVHAQGTVLAVHAQPGAKRNAVLGTRRGASRRGDRTARERQGQCRHRGRARRKPWLSLITACSHFRGDFAPEAVSRHRRHTR